METFLIVAFGAALAGFVQGLSGFGFGLTAMALWARRRRAGRPPARALAAAAA